MTGRKGFRKPQDGSGRLRDSESVAAGERLWWRDADVLLAERSPSGLVQVLVRSGGEDRWLEPGLRDPFPARLRSASVRRALLRELEPRLRRLRSLAAAEVRRLHG